MSRTRLAALACVALVTTLAAAKARRLQAPATTREVIAVWVGTEGTDAASGMVEAVRDMKTALQRQAISGGWHFVIRGVSLEPTVGDGLQHLALLGGFDEVDVGGNWTNSSVVRYLGPDMSNHQRALIPQVVLLEREIRRDPPSGLVVGAEREIGRYLGTRDIKTWVNAGAPLPK